MINEIDVEATDRDYRVNGECSCDCANKQCSPLDSIGASTSASWDVANTY